MQTARPLQYGRFDRFLTAARDDDGTPLEFVILEIYEPGWYGGSLVSIGDKLCVNIFWVDEISTAELAARGWLHIGGPSFQPGTPLQ